MAFDLGWDFVPQHYHRIEDSRQRDQIKQALRSHKQNIVEGSSERSLSAKLKLYDVSKSSGAEAIEDFEDILRLEGLSRWDKDDPRLKKLRQVFEAYPFPNPSAPSIPPSSFSQGRNRCSRRIRGKRGTRGSGKLFNRSFNPSWIFAR